MQGLAWEAGDAVNMGIGQGFVLATPLQLTALTTAIANGGELMRPTLIDRIGDDAPLVWPTTSAGRLPLAPEHSAAIQEGMWGVANSELGTAFERFRRLAVPVAGKTGTSEAGDRPHAFFVGYAPAAPYTAGNGQVIAEPEIAIVVLLEHSGEGSEVAAPVFRRLVELYYGLRPLTLYPAWQQNHNAGRPWRNLVDAIVAQRRFHLRQSQQHNLMFSRQLPGCIRERLPGK